MRLWALSALQVYLANLFPITANLRDVVFPTISALLNETSNDTESHQVQEILKMTLQVESEDASEEVDLGEVGDVGYREILESSVVAQENTPATKAAVELIHLLIGSVHAT